MKTLTEEMEENWTTKSYGPVTIDAPHSKDLDDAVALEYLGGDTEKYRLSVWVTNVGGMVKPDGKWDKIARRRMETKYFDKGSKPMLSRAFERRLSLDEGEERSAIRVDMTFDEDFDVVNTDISIDEGFVSQKRHTFEEVADAYSEWPDNDAPPPVQGLKRMVYFADTLLNKRRSRGALAIYDLRKGIVTDEEGNVTRLDRREDTVGYVVIQEFMILANREVARWSATNNVPFIYRNHLARNAAPDREVIQSQIDNLGSGDDEPIQRYQSQAHLMFEPATYDAVVLQHWGLNLTVYCHATSPIRRYVDLVNQRQIIAHLAHEPYRHNQKELSEIAEGITERLRGAKEERAKIMKKKANRSALRRLGDRGYLDECNDKDFERAVKVALRSNNITDEIVESYQNRAGDEDALPNPAILAVLSEYDWSEVEGQHPLITATASHFEQLPHVAKSLYYMGVQSELWPEVEVEHQHVDGPPHAPIFEARINDDGTEVKSIAGSKKEAVQQVHALYLSSRMMCAPELPEFDAPQEESSQIESNEAPSIVGVKELKLGTLNPIGNLQEWCQKNAFNLPEYEYEKGGSDHDPCFVCRATINDVKLTTVDYLVGFGKGANKKDSKRKAAEILIESLHKRLGADG